MNNSDLSENRKLATAPIDLTLEIRSEDGSSAEFYQNDEAMVANILRLLSTPRLFSQPLLVLASPHSISLIPCRTTDMILAYTSAPAPLRWPGGVPEITESAGDWLDGDAADSDVIGNGSFNKANTASFHIQVYTVGGWDVTLVIKPVETATVLDERRLMLHLFDLPAIPFRLTAGGIGLVNPAKISRVTALPPATLGPGGAWPALQAVPDTALPVDLVRCIPLVQRQA